MEVFILNVLGAIDTFSSLLTYVSISLAVYRLSVKAGLSKRSWWAWVPVLDVLLVLSMIKKSYWWVWGFFIYFLSLFLLNQVFGAFFWTSYFGLTLSYFVRPLVFWLSFFLLAFMYSRLLISFGKKELGHFSISL